MSIKLSKYQSNCHNIKCQCYQSVWIRLAHRLYSDFQYFFLKFLFKYFFSRCRHSRGYLRRPWSRLQMYLRSTPTKRGSASSDRWPPCTCIFIVEWNTDFPCLFDQKCWQPFWSTYIRRERLETHSSSSTQAEWRWKKREKMQCDQTQYKTEEELEQC